MTVAALALAMAAPPAFEFDQQWSLSGKQYVTIGSPLQSDLFHVKHLSFDGVVGYEPRSTLAPVTGFGVSYSFQGPITLRAGVFVLFPQNGRPDICLSVGVRF